jgi:S1-C subfamily serine protease
VKGLLLSRHNASRMLKNMLLCVSGMTIAFSQIPADTPSSIPVATQWLYDAVAPGARGTIDSVVRISCKKTGLIGTGFILDTGYVITNNHVVQGCAAGDLDVRTSVATRIETSELWVDPSAISP